MCVIQRFIGWGMGRLRRFTVCDVAVFKVLLLSVGTLCGMHLSRTRKKFAPVLWAVVAASYVYLIWRMVFCDDKA